MSAGFVERGGLWVLAQFALMAAVAVLGALFPGSRPHLPLRLLAVALTAAGSVLGLSGVVVLGRNRTPFPKPPAGGQFVRHGIYAKLRHPLYSSVICLALAWALWRGSLPALVVALLLLPFLNAKARREERWLRERFPEYAEYARRVPRFFPRLRVR